MKELVAKEFVKPKKRQSIKFKAKVVDENIAMSASVSTEIVSAEPGDARYQKLQMLIEELKQEDGFLGSKSMLSSSKKTTYHDDGNFTYKPSIIEFSE